MQIMFCVYLKCIEIQFHLQYPLKNERMINGQRLNNDLTKRKVYEENMLSTAENSSNEMFLQWGLLAASHNYNPLHHIRVKAEISETVGR